jgi:hypothetical protein
VLRDRLLATFSSSIEAQLIYQDAIDLLGGRGSGHGGQNAEA